MNVTILLVCLVVFAFVGGQLLHRFLSRYISSSGAEYLLVGALVGPQVSPGLVTANSLDKLVPLMNLLLGLVGFLVGLRVRQSFIGWRASLVGVLASASTFVIVALGVASFAAMVLPASGGIVFDQVLFVGGGWVFELYAARNHLLLGLALGATATVSSSGLLVSLGESLNLSSTTYGLLRSIAASSQLFAILAMGAVLAISRDSVLPPVANIGRFVGLGAAVLLGLIYGVCFMLFIGKEEAQSRIFLATVGTVTFAAGTGAATGVSPLLVNLVSGLTVAYVSPHASSLLKELNRLQHPIFVLLLILTGAYWSPVTGPLWLFPLVYVGLRLAATLGSTWLLTRLFTRHVVAERVGIGLMAQGTLAVAVATDYALAAPEMAAIALTAALLGTLTFDIWGARGVRRVLVDAEGDELNLAHTGSSDLTQGKEAGL